MLNFRDTSLRETQFFLALIILTRSNLGTQRKEIETLESVGDSSGLPFALQTLILNIESSQERGKDFGSEEAGHQCKSAGGRSVSGCDVS